MQITDVAVIGARGYVGSAYSKMLKRRYSVHGIDESAENVDRARFAASVRGDRSAQFEVLERAAWGTGSPEPADLVVLHEFPSRELAAVCRLAKRGIFLRASLSSAGPFDSLADGEVPVPGSARAMLRGFREHGFLPVHIAESRARRPDGGWGACEIYLRRCEAGALPEADAPAKLELELVPGGESALDVVVYNWSAEAVPVVSELVLEGPRGAPLEEALLSDFRLAPRVDERGRSLSRSYRMPIPRRAPLAGVSAVRATLRDGRSGFVLAQRRVPLLRS